MRGPRKQSESDVYHVVMRGSGRQLIFEDDADRVKFLDTLAADFRERGIELYAWCLMSNHVHLLVHAPIEVISSCMRKSLGAYAIYFNAKTGHVGHVFQNRFMSEPIDSDEYLIAAMCYIHNNPVKAGLSSVDRYPWSSYHEYIGTPRYCSTDFIMSIAGDEKTFKEMHLSLAPKGIQAQFLDVDAIRTATRAMADDDAIKIAERILGPIRLNEIKALNPAERNEIIAELKRSGLSVRQIERMTGIGRNIIQRAK